MEEVYSFARDLVVYGALGLGALGVCIGISVIEDKLKEVWKGRGRSLLEEELD
ncbi:MAG: hypothetical protein KKF56_00750 [Nanoarchaeota archaeon]|nr:hypothetical protein [Nanoarchaeota archaeon]